jgi:methylated-DNA-[protein]-cysteine S-methyltransferase
LIAYFDGELGALGEIEIATAGTAFQEAAWAALRAIPAGATRSYAQQAAAIGRPRAVRAVGRANGDNPVAIVTPCHRVIGAGGDLTGFGGGLHRKRWLLEHEGALARG